VLTETIVVRLTPPGKSAIACLGISGPVAWDAVRSHFRRGNNAATPELPSPRQTLVGRFGDPASGSDEVLVFYRQNDPTPIVEIHCHGGPEVVKLIERLLVARGVRPVSLAEWWTVHEGRDRAEMLDVLTRCTTARTAAIALDQLNGAFEQAIKEPHPDFARLLELIPLGEHLATPWKVALAGAPNVGKSSLVNALVGYTRCVVSPTPGTTRDIVTTQIALDGWPIELIDTAGLRESHDELEAAGIDRAAAAHQDADLVLWVLDATTRFAPPPLTRNSLAIINKIDAASAWDWDQIPEAARVSASTGEGVERLAAAIVERLVPRPPQAGEAVPIIESQRDLVRNRSKTS
jgi:tRNA modification GTPase